MFSVIFITEMSTAAVFQLSLTNVERLSLIYYLQLKCLRLQFSSCFQCFQPVGEASTFDIVFATEVSTAAVLQLFSMFSTSTSSIYVSLS